MCTSCRGNTNWRFQILFSKLHLQNILLTKNSKCTFFQNSKRRPPILRRFDFHNYFLFGVNLCGRARKFSSPPVATNCFTNSRPRPKVTWTVKKDTKDKGEYKPEFEPNTTSKWKPNECLNVRNPFRPSQFPLLLDKEALQTNCSVSLSRGTIHSYTLLPFCDSVVGIYTAQ
jgi:hypothetical protein